MADSDPAEAEAEAPAPPERNPPIPRAPARDWSKIGNGDVSPRAGGNGFGSAGPTSAAEGADESIEDYQKVKGERRFAMDFCAAKFSSWANIQVWWANTFDRKIAVILHYQVMFEFVRFLDSLTCLYVYPRCPGPRAVHRRSHRLEHRQKCIHELFSKDHASLSLPPSPPPIFLVVVITSIQALAFQMFPSSWSHAAFKMTPKAIYSDLVTH